MKSRLVLAALALILAGTAATAHHNANCPSNPTAFGTSPATIYVDDREASGQGLWIYAESNGIPGLQTGGRHPAGWSEDAACTHPNPDTLIF